MKSIYKYPLALNHTTLTLPIGAKPLSVGLDPSTQLCLWAEVDTNQEQTEERFISVKGTGWEYESAPALKFVGTVTQGVYVWHVFLETSEYI